MLFLNVHNNRIRFFEVHRRRSKFFFFTALDHNER
jgi:hypothetical protein